MEETRQERETRARTEYRAEQTKKAKRTIKKIVAGVIILGAIITLLIVNPIVTIGQHERGVVLHWGAVQEKILEPGIHWVTPIMTKVKEMDITIRKVEGGAITASSKDLQSVSSKIALNYRLDPVKVGDIYSVLGYAYEERVIEPAIQEAVKKTSASYTAEELITKRGEVKDTLQLAIKTSIEPLGFIVKDIFITDFDFSKTFNAAIEAKVTAEQSALEAKNKLEQVKFEAQQKVERARADALAIKIQAEAIAAQGGMEYVKLKAVEQWNGVLPTRMIPNGAVPFLNLDN